MVAPSKFGREGRCIVSLLALFLWLGCASSGGRGIAGPTGEPPLGSSAPPAEDAVVATIPIRGFGTAVALSPDGSRAYVTVDGAVLVIDTASRQVSATIATGETPHAIVLSPDGKRGYAVDLLQYEMWILDLTSARVLRSIPLGARRTPVLRPGIALGAGGRTAYITISQPEGQGFDTLQIIDLASGISTQRGLDFHPGALGVDPKGLLWIAGCTGLCSDGTLQVIDPASLGAIAKRPLPSVPGELAFTPGGSRVLVANGSAGSVSVFDVASRAELARIRVDAEPLGVAAAPGGRRAYVTSFAAGILSAIDLATNTVVATAKVGASPRAIAVAPDGRSAYLTHSTSTISVVDLTRLGAP